MDSKNYTQVLIDGKIYTLGGNEEESYLQRVASYVNEKIRSMKKEPNFAKQSAEYQAVVIELNLADDYYKAMERADGVEKQIGDMEKETYSLKHELVSTQMKLGAVLKDLEERQKQIGELKEARKDLERSIRSYEKGLEEAQLARTSLEAALKKAQKDYEELQMRSQTDTAPVVTLRPRQAEDARAIELRADQAVEEEEETGREESGRDTLGQEQAAASIEVQQELGMMGELEDEPDEELLSAVSGAPEVAPYGSAKEDKTEMEKKAIRAAMRAAGHRSGRK